MAQRKLVVLAVVAAAGAAAVSIAHAQIFLPPAPQAYPAPQPYPAASRAVSRPRNAPPPNFDALDDDDDLPQGSVARAGTGAVAG